MSSLRGRVMLGAGLWTMGLISVLGLAFPFFFRPARPGVHPHVFRITLSHGIILHSSTLIVIAIACMVAGLILVQGALTPFATLRARLAGVRNGTDRRLSGQYSAEVQPLVDELNALLSHSKLAVARADARAGDLAHGLKTPLAILSNEADRLASKGDIELAAILAQQVALMQRQIEYHLAHARAAASGTALRARSPVAESVEGLRRALGRLHASRGIAIESEVAPEHAFLGRREDLDEVLGNLLDNACQWAKSRVRVGSEVRDGRIVLTVDDDGPGIPRALRESVLQRGVRADEAAPGSGLGLAIVRDLAELYGGTIALETSPWGGLRARLELPGEAGPAGS